MVTPAAPRSRRGVTITALVTLSAPGQLVGVTITGSARFGDRGSFCRTIRRHHSPGISDLVTDLAHLVRASVTKRRKTDAAQRGSPKIYREAS